MNTTEMPVIFRFHEGELLALFPTEAADTARREITCYAHVGQHGGACLSLLRLGRPAKPEEFADLLDELRGIYESSDDPVKLRVAKRDHAAYREARNAMARAYRTH
jgi:hypothetical protein